MRTLYVLSGFPGSGKSHWAKTYAKEHPETHIVSSDKIREAYFGSRQNMEHEKEVWNIFLQELHRFPEEENNCTVIADCTNLTNYYRSYYNLQTPEYDRHILVILDVSFERSSARNSARIPEKKVPQGAMDHLKAQYEAPNKETLDLYDEVLYIRP